MESFKTWAATNPYLAMALGAAVGAGVAALAMRRGE